MNRDEVKGDGESLWLRLHSYIFGICSKTVSSADDQITKTLSLHTDYKYTVVHVLSRQLALT